MDEYVVTISMYKYFFFPQTKETQDYLLTRGSQRRHVEGKGKVEVKINHQGKGSSLTGLPKERWTEWSVMEVDGGVERRIMEETNVWEGEC